MAGAQGLDARRTVVVSGVPALLTPDRMADKLTIHFQTRRRSAGGDVAGVTYPTDMQGVAFVTFDRAEDAANVVKKDQQVMIDEEFRDDYTLTVFPFSPDVFLYINSAKVDLSVFGDPASLVVSLRSTYRSIRFQHSPQQTKVTIEGPFSAVRSLREDLTARVTSLKHLAQSPSIGTKVNSPKASLKLKVPDETLGAGGREQMTAQRRLEMSSNYRTDGSSPRRREVVGAEAFTRTASSFAEQEMSVKPKKLFRVPSAGTKDHSKVPSSPASSERGRSPLGDQKGARGRRSNDADDIWVEEYTFKYIEKFHKKHLRGLDVSVEGTEGSDLVRISLSDKEPSRKDAAENLKFLITSLQANLRVHTISLDKDQLRSKRELTKICDDVALPFKDVLYVLEDSCIKVIGPPVSAIPFCVRLEDQIQEVSGH
ncbi:RNA-binding protein 43 [Oryzias melastigma]|uniref:RNA-binding protein 43 n=1 Tax=Oryzias melastigma TaxID=30732 RepID=A0A834CW33_ORYME|nr:RNA-binding protein 43 [Oryzias melastigma]